MRLIRLKISTKEKILLRAFSVQLNIPDVGFTYDVYSLVRLKGTGIPAPERIVALAKTFAATQGTHEFGVRALMNKRAQLLRNFSKTSYFIGLVQLRGAIEATQSLLSSFKLLYRKVRQSQCLSCSYLSDCDFGKQYGTLTTSIGSVVDPDYSKKVHASCPALPSIESANQYSVAVEALELVALAELRAETRIASNLGDAPLAKLAENEALVDKVEVLSEDDVMAAQTLNVTEDEYGEYFSEWAQTGSTSGGPSNYFDDSLSGADSIRVTEAVINSLSLAQLAVYDLGVKFSLLLGSKKAGKFAPTEETSKDRSSRNIESVSDIAKVKSSSHGLPEEVFDKKLVTNELVKTQHLKPEAKRPLLYVLVDVSGSMQDLLSTRGNSLYATFRRKDLASIMMLSLTRRVELDGGIMFMRPFAGRPGPLQEARSKQSYEDLRNHLSLMGYTGGGTDLTSVIRKACSDIAASQGEISKSELLLITDCEDVLNESSLRSTLGTQELNVLDVAGGRSVCSAAKVLKRVANKYYKANQGALDINQLVELI